MDVRGHQSPLSEWAAEYIESRTLAPGTLRDYTRILRVHIHPTIGSKYLDEVTVSDVAAWHARLKKEMRARARKANRSTDGSGEAAQTYKFLSAVFKAAIARGLIDASPARVVAGGRHKAARATRGGRRGRGPGARAGAARAPAGAGRPAELDGFADR
ncbi:phage integrase central domain-containing protein [Krasilnikoviella flava]|uniref:phage integrase central domain-containing protein n=1 Tax=Krasilnikoviella flava TaxID=526729 RepID=UPI0009A89F7E|nr:hypothetical protein [Krasilnikoviella flava]